MKFNTKRQKSVYSAVQPYAVCRFIKVVERKKDVIQEKKANS